MTSRAKLLGFLVALAVMAAACGSDDSGGVTTTTAGPTSTVSTTTTLPPSTTTTSSTTIAPTTTSTGVTTTTIWTSLPGDPFDIVPANGTPLAVVGVAFDDVLNVREGPGVDFDVVTTLAPTSEEVVSVGEGRLLSRSIWWRVVANGTEGWANSSFLGMLGVVDDLTFMVVDDVGRIPVAETMLDLGLIVVDTFRSEDPASRVVVSVAPSVGDLGEVTYDVVGIGDDAQLGYRLHVFGQEDESGEAFNLKSVEATILCGRGVTEDGECK